MSIVLQSSGGGSVTINEPTTASNFTQTLPASDGTVVTTGTPASGNVIQVVNATTTTETSNSSSTYADTTLTASITPKFSTSKILVLVSQNGCQKSVNSTYLNLILLRNSSSLVEFGGQAANNSSASNAIGGISLCYLDSPSTTSATTYKTQLSSGANLASVRVQNNSCNSTITLMEIAQ